MPVKLTETKALNIKRRVALRHKLLNEAGKLSNAALAEKFGKAPSSINRIVNGHSATTCDDFRLIQQCGIERRRLVEVAMRHSNDAIARDYRLCQSTVSKIGSGLLWGSLPDLEDL